MFHEICSDRIECSKSIFNIYEKLNKITNPFLVRGDKIHINMKNIHDTQKKVNIIVKELRVQKKNKGGGGDGDGGGGDEERDGESDDRSDGGDDGDGDEESNDNTPKKYGGDEGDRIIIYG
jgi:hypothetical protein